MNIFNTDQATKDFQFMLDNAAYDILINENVSKGLITSPSLNRIVDFDDRYISTLDILKRGDLITYKDKPYLIISEIESMRQINYKAIMRHCNYHITIPGGTELVDTGYTDIVGNPIYEEVEIDPIDLPIIIDNRKFSVTGDQAINVPENQIIIMLQVNDETEEYNVGDSFNVIDQEWNIIDVDKTKVGLYIWTAERN